jgi:hypothetical protein
MIFGMLRSGSNYDDSQERLTGGLNGFGAKLANVLSTSFSLETVDADTKKKYVQTWTNNMSDKTEPVVKACRTKPYTRVTFQPELKFFGLEEITDDMIALMKKRLVDIGFASASNTVVGDALLRGVSGGERKRVAVGEVLVGGQSLFLCDEISTGLDSAATFDTIKALRTWCKTLGGPELVEQFDDILMVNEGHMVYHGPRTEILDYFQGLGFTRPPRVDPVDFLIEVTSGRGRRYANGTVPVKELASTSEDFKPDWLSCWRRYPHRERTIPPTGYSSRSTA